MVRIAGIDHEFTTLELLWYQASKEERIRLSAQCLATACGESGSNFDINIELDNDNNKTDKFKISIEKNV